MQYTHFSKSERLELSILREKGYSVRAIANAMMRNPSSVSREIRRNRYGYTSRYDARNADHKAYRRRKYSKYQGMKINEDAGLEQYVVTGLKRYWSPQSIAGRLRRQTDGAVTIKADTIYKWIYSPYGQPYAQYLKSKRSHCRRRKGVKCARVLIKNRTSIEDRPDEVNTRSTFGHWEGDTMGRPKSASAATLVVVRERTSRVLRAVRVRRLKYAIEGFRALLDAHAQSLTLDNGVENQRHEELGVPTYFCHPYSSWEKGSVEQGIGALRQFIPKRADLKDYTPERIRAILEILNNRPMKCLDYQTPNEVCKEQS
ncbi:MAG: IS30 family transposase [bacterium]|nr:IS30 family transposase [bacterium]